MATVFTLHALLLLHMSNMQTGVVTGSTCSGKKQMRKANASLGRIRWQRKVGWHAMLMLHMNHTQIVMACTAWLADVSGQV